MLGWRKDVGNSTVSHDGRKRRGGEGIRISNSIGIPSATLGCHVRVLKIPIMVEHSDSVDIVCNMAAQGELGRSREHRPRATLHVKLW